jgi:TM2 domain-containing membrane protein YozV
MGLMNCLDCGKQISDSAPSCLHCGRPYRTKAKLQAQFDGKEKSKMVAGLLAIFLGGIGAHKFYMNQLGYGILWIFLTVITLGLWMIVSFLEGIVFMCHSDERFNEVYIRGKRK